MLKESFLMSLENIKNNKMRSFLTMLGILIGVAAIIALITIVQGVTNNVIDQFSELGAGKITVQASGNALKQGLNENDIQAITTLDKVAGVSPTVTLGGTAARNGHIMEDLVLEGKNEVYFANTDDAVMSGRGLNINDMSGNSNVCIIDEKVAEGLFFGENPVGSQLYLGGRNYTVVGLMEAGSSFMSLSGSNDGKIVIPYKNALDIAGAANINLIEIYLHDADTQDQATLEVENILDAAFNYKDDSFTIIDLDSVLNIMSEMSDMMTTMLAGIASIALLVGGVGIMNMMLVSVTERTKEIGLRKALGAKPKQIQQQFIIEAILLSFFGGFLGLIGGLIISYVAAILLDIAFAPSMAAIGLGIGFSAAVGIIFGWTPARKASALKPIDALRS